MRSSYYSPYSQDSPGEEEQKDALRGMRIHAQNMKEQGRNFWGKELKVDPSKGKGAAAQANITKYKSAFTPHEVAGTGRSQATRQIAFDKVNNDLMKSAWKANEAVGSLAPEATKTGLKILDTSSIAPEMFKAATPEIAAKAGAEFAAGAAGQGMNIASAGGTAAASTGLQAAASTAMPYLLAAQLALGFLGAKADKHGHAPGGSQREKEEEQLQMQVTGW